GALVGRGAEIEVKAMAMRVMRPDDVLLTKLMAMNEHAMNYESCLEIARALREKIDWDYVRKASAASPFARAFFELVDGLGIVQRNVSVQTPPMTAVPTVIQVR